MWKHVDWTEFGFGLLIWLVVACMTTILATTTVMVVYAAFKAMGF